MAELTALSADKVCRLTGLSQRQLRYWEETGFFVPREERSSSNRVYSFRDLVGLRTIALLRKRHKLPLQELRKVSAWLSERYEAPWASLTFYVASGGVYFDDPKSGARMLGQSSGQTALPIEMRDIADEAEAAAARS